MSEDQVIQLRPVRFGFIEITVKGETPLLTQRFSEETGKDIADAQGGGVKTKKRAARDPQHEYEQSMYEIEPGVYGFPAIGFKKAMVSACRYFDSIAMTEARGAFFVLGDLLEIRSNPPKFRMDRTVLQKRTTTVAYRAQFDNWEVTLPIKYDKEFISPDAIVTLLEQAGFSVGVGGWRPECSGNFGMFTVAAS